MPLVVLDNSLDYALSISNRGDDNTIRSVTNIDPLTDEHFFPNSRTIDVQRISYFPEYVYDATNGINQSYEEQAIDAGAKDCLFVDDYLKKTDISGDLVDDTTRPVRRISGKYIAQFADAILDEGVSTPSCVLRSQRSDNLVDPSRDEEDPSYLALKNNYKSYIESGQFVQNADIIVKNISIIGNTQLSSNSYDNGGLAGMQLGNNDRHQTYVDNVHIKYVHQGLGVWGGSSLIENTRVSQCFSFGYDFWIAGNVYFKNAKSKELGGPGIITTAGVEEDRGTAGLSHINTYFLDDTQLSNSWLLGQEAWFNLNGYESMVTQLKGGVAQLLTSSGINKTFLNNNDTKFNPLYFGLYNGFPSSKIDDGHANHAMYLNPQTSLNPFVNSGEGSTFAASSDNTTLNSVLNMTNQVLASFNISPASIALQFDNGSWVVPKGTEGYYLSIPGVTADKINNPDDAHYLCVYNYYPTGEYLMFVLRLVE
jgi:hypothetical protein